ncbi:MAG: hypothetical protein ACREUH_07290 [Burkholderiales bacterium]
MKSRQPLGADLVIPALALGFAVYFFVDIADLGWEAKANGVLIGVMLVLLVVVQLARMALQLSRGAGDFGFGPLWRPADVMRKRLGMVVLAAGFIAALPWLGLTLALWIAMLLALLVMGVRKPSTLVWLPLAVAGATFVLFIVVLQSDFPHGPIEKLLS